VRNMVGFYYSFILLLIVSPSFSQNWTCPFSRVLQVGDSGKDVLILQTLIARSSFVEGVNPTGTFDEATSKAIHDFQAGNNIQPPSGILDIPTSNLLLHLHSYDGYKDDGTIPPGYKYKVHIKVSQNRSIETVGFLYNDKMELLYQFPARLHGEGVRNQFCTDGNTPTGLSLFDLNSPEDDPKSFGPYPINRVVSGLKGNAELLLSNNKNTIRSGILLHTGEWSNWQPPQPMPNSDGCIHTWPNSCKQIWNILVSIGVVVRQNTGGALPYPYEPQGIISIEEEVN